MACAPKSNASYKAIENSLKDIEKKIGKVPYHLRNISFKNAENMVTDQIINILNDYNKNFRATIYA